MNKNAILEVALKPDTKCPVCNSRCVQRLPDDWCEAPMFLCVECPVVFQLPSPALATDVFGNYRAGVYWSRQSRLSRVLEEALLSWRLETAANRLLEIESALGQPLGIGERVLDVGCGPAEVIFLASVRRSCSVVGLEPSSREAILTRTRYGINVVSADAVTLPFCERFDVILALHLIEHVTDPVRVVRTLLEALDDGGRLLIECPNLLVPSGGMPIRRFFEAAHLWTFSLQSLVAVVGQAGGRVVFQTDEGFLRLVAVRGGGLPQTAEMPASSSSSSSVHGGPISRGLNAWAVLERYRDSYWWSEARMGWWWTRVLVASHVVSVAGRWFARAMSSRPFSGSSA